MSYGAKYLLLTLFCIAVCVCAFAGVYYFIGGKLSADERAADSRRVAFEPDTPAAEASVRENAGLLESPEAPDTVEALNVEDTIGRDTKIVYEYYYSDENKLEREEQNAPPSLLNLTRQQLIERIEGFSVISFSPSEVVLRKTISPQKKKYIISVWEGRVAVFYDGGVEVESIREITDTPVSSLSEYEQKRLEAGIIVEGDIELMKVLEDYGS